MTPLLDFLKIIDYEQVTVVLYNPSNPGFEYYAVHALNDRQDFEELPNLFENVSDLFAIYFDVSADIVDVYLDAQLVRK